MLEALDVIGDENRSIEVSVVFFFIILNGLSLLSLRLKMDLGYRILFQFLEAKILSSKVADLVILFPLPIWFIQ
jgi:hypothetical protein